MQPNLCYDFDRVVPEDLCSERLHSCSTGLSTSTSLSREAAGTQSLLHYSPRPDLCTVMDCNSGPCTSVAPVRDFTSTCRDRAKTVLAAKYARAMVGLYSALRPHPPIQAVQQAVRDPASQVTAQSCTLQQGHPHCAAAA